MSSLRALGTNPLLANERRLFDIDIANLGKLVEDIVLFDKVRYINTAENSRDLGRILGDAVEPVTINNQIKSICNKEAYSRLQQGVSVVGLFNALGLIPKSYWFCRRTFEYLVLEGLGVEGKYSEEMRTLLFEPDEVEKLDHELAKILGGHNSQRYSNADKDVDWNEWLAGVGFASCGDRQSFEYDGDGPWLESNSIGHRKSESTMEELTTQLLWLYQRTCYYSILSEALSIPYSPHSLRNQFLVHSLLSKETFRMHDQSSITNIGKYDILRKQIMDSLENEVHQSMKYIKEIFGNCFLDVEIPPVFYHVISKVDNLSDILSLTYEIRESKSVKHYRKVCSDLEKAISLGDSKFLIKIRKEIAGLYKNLRKEYGIDRSNASQIKIGLGPIIHTEHIELPRLLFKQYFARKNYLVFLRDIYHDLMRISRLGRIYDALFWQVLKMQ